MPYWSDDFEPSRPRKVSGGIKARSQRGEMGRSWWSGRWRQALERLTDPGRLSRGRSYARQGQVISIDETNGMIHARVQGSQPKPYRVTIQLRALTDRTWEDVLDVLAGEALFAARLLAGEMPQEIEQAFTAAHTSLFPVTRSELVTACSCPDMANPCKHIAAVYYLLGEAFDDDPFLLFRLRGRTREQVLEGLNARRAAQEPAGEAASLEGEPAALPLNPLAFWSLVQPLEDFPIDPREPETPLAVLHLLGQPAFTDLSFQNLLGPIYQAVSKQAADLAFEEIASGDSSPSPQPADKSPESRAQSD
ncbi:MAG TPA: SWIM zinc finger family protein [Anaerolineaceae bacterium]|nr:SWIM zinc finger family protein [Anaerolineaceae bacterium]